MSWTRVAVGGVVIAAFVGGFLIADDSSRVDDLEEQVVELEATTDEQSDDLAAAESAAEEAESLAGDLLEERNDLRKRLRAEFAISGRGTSGDGSSDVSVNTDFSFDAAGKVGPFVVKPTAFEKTSNGWLLTLDVNNDGDSPEDPFCGGGESQLVDTQGRTFDGDSVLADETANCGDSLQPGLNATYKVSYKTPGDAEPAAIAIWGDSFVVDPSEAKIWGVP